MLPDESAQATGTDRHPFPVRAFKGLLFDADGTLYDSSPLHFEAYRRTSRELYGFDFTLELFKAECIGKYKKPTQVLREHGVPCVDADFRSRKRPYYVALATEKLATTKGLLDLLQAATSHRIPCAVVTGASSHSTDISIDLLGIRHYFFMIITREDTDHQKPLPHPYLLAAKRLGLPPSDCCAFEDTTLGIASAKAAGTYCVAIRNGGNVPEELKAADCIVDDFAHLLYNCEAGVIRLVQPRRQLLRAPRGGHGGGCVCAGK